MHADSSPSPDAGLLRPTPPTKNIARHTGRNVSSERKATIYTLADTLKLTASAIANRLAMDSRTVNAILQNRDYGTAMARNLLDANAVTAAAAWVKAIKVGGAKGRHEPARDLLLHRRVIEPVMTTSVSASVQVVLNGGALPDELSTITVAAEAVPHDEQLG